jgi:MAD (mothers against decapentaplegic) interacting protein
LNNPYSIVNGPVFEQQVGYEVGSKGEALPTLFVSELDAALIPVITGNFLSSLDALLVMELFFHVIFK